MFLFGPPKASDLYQKKDVKGLIKLLNTQKDPEVRESAADYLGKLRDPGAVDALIAAANDPVLMVKRRALDALSNFNDPRIFGLLCEVLKKEGERYTSALQGVIKAGPKAVRPIVDFLNSPYAKTGDCIQTAVDGLKNFNWQADDSQAGMYYWVFQGQWEKCIEIGSPILPAMFVYLKTCSSKELKTLLLVLGKIKDARSLTYLVEKMKVKDLSETCVEAIGEYGGPEAAEILLPMYFKYKKASNSYLALLKVGSPAVDGLLPILSGMRDGIKEAYEEPWAYTIYTIELLGRIGDKKAAEPILKAMFLANKHAWPRFEFYYGNLFEGYTGCIQDAVTGYTAIEHAEYTEGGSSGDVLRTFTYDTQKLLSAVDILCQWHTPIATNLLHLIGSRKDPIVVKQSGYYAGRGGFIEEPLDLTTQRTAAQAALEQLGSPAYDENAFLVASAWKLA